MCRIPEKIAMSGAISASARRAEWELDHLLKKSSPLFFRSLSLRKSSQIPILMTRNPRESCGSPSFLPSFLPLSSPSGNAFWQTFVIERCDKSVNWIRTGFSCAATETKLLFFCFACSNKRISIPDKFVLRYSSSSLFFCFCCKLHLVCFQERTQLIFSCDQERSGGHHNSDGNRKFFGFLDNLSSSSSSYKIRYGSDGGCTCRCCYKWVAWRGGTPSSKNCIRLRLRFLSRWWAWAEWVPIFFPSSSPWFSSVAAQQHADFSSLIHTQFFWIQIADFLPGLETQFPSNPTSRISSLVWDPVFWTQ